MRARQRPTVRLKEAAMSNELNVGLQDGMLAHYNEQARASDVNVEARLDREPFDFRLHTTRPRHSRNGGKRDEVQDTHSG